MKKVVGGSLIKRVSLAISNNQWKDMLLQDINNCAEFKFTNFKREKINLLVS